MINNIKKHPYRNCFNHFIKDIKVGYITYDLIYDKIEIVDIFVEEKYRNKKIATDLMKKVVSLAKEKKCLNITLEVSVNNLIAIKLYKKLGFKEIAKRVGYYDGVDGILMELIV